MARCAVIDGTVVVNVIEADADFVLAGFRLVTSNVAGPGWTYEGGRFSPPPRSELPVPSSVTNYQARAVMRMTPMPDGRSLLEAVRSALKVDLDRVQSLPDMDPDRVASEVAWEAWEQANVYERNGPLVSSLASRFGLSDAMTDDLFRQAEQVTA